MSCRAFVCNAGYWILNWYARLYSQRCVCVYIDAQLLRVSFSMQFVNGLLKINV